MSARESQAAGVELRGEAATAYGALVTRLVEAADAGYLTPCRTVGFAFLSEDRDDRAAAASTCLECPAMVVCARFALANSERFGVWGGVDCTTGSGLGPAAAVQARLALIVGGA